MWRDGNELVRLSSPLREEMGFPKAPSSLVASFRRRFVFPSLPSIGNGIAFSHKSCLEDNLCRALVSTRTPLITCFALGDILVLAKSSTQREVQKYNVVPVRRQSWMHAEFRY